MLKELLKNKIFSSIMKEFLKKEELIDIIIFGSFVREKENPNDLDILVLYSNKINEKINYSLRKRLENIYKNVQVISKNYLELLSPEFLARESIISEGFSLKSKRFISEGFGYKNLVLFRYNLKKMTKSKRVNFYYALHGRNKNAGLLKKNNCYKFSDSVIFCPIENSETLTEFFEKLSLDYIKFPILIPQRAIKNNIK